MKLHEHQGKNLLKRFGIPVPRGVVSFSADEAVAALDSFSFPLVVKAQIHAGGRGKGGGVKVARSKEEAIHAIRSIFGMQLVTQQTGPAGKKVSRLLVEEACDIDREFYVGLTLDRSLGRLTLMASTEGGMEIEEVAARSPEKILREVIDPKNGMTNDQGNHLAHKLGLPPKTQQAFAAFAQALTRAYVECDASLVEINPLVVTRSGALMALDAKVTIDDNALFRHPEMESFRDITEEDPAEREASAFGLNYISLDGNIGCMVNGAGLAMATMDLIQLSGGKPANFLDVGGSATRETVTEAFKIILRDSKVKGILVNIFGGIMKCDVIAEGIVAATRELHVKVPVVVRLRGTRVKEGRELLAQSGLNLIPAEGLAEAAKKIVRTLHA